MDVAVCGGVLKLIFTLVVAIGAKADTAKQNRKECLRIARRAAKLQHALAAQSCSYTLAAATRDSSAVASVLEDLRLALCRALEGVMACQRRDCQGALLSRLLKAAKVSAELRRLRKDINDGIMDVLLVTCIYTNGLAYTHLFQSDRN